MFNHNLPDRLIFFDGSGWKEITGRVVSIETHIPTLTYPDEYSMRSTVTRFVSQSIVNVEFKGLSAVFKDLGESPPELINTVPTDALIEEIRRRIRNNCV